MPLTVTIPLQPNYMIEPSAVGAAMQNLFDAAMAEGIHSAAITGRTEGRALVVTLEARHRQEPATEPAIAPPRRGRPPKSSYENTASA